uniref:MBL fold metallo-hydrolase n=1 Tax=Paenibacillus terrae TaxID=159743 RepID=UPI0011A95F4A|nr:MBL fold metallo-hydrolase [Paenibacillus terrae]
MNIPEITHYEDGIIQVKMAMSSPLRWVNSYILRGPSGGVTVIDPGPRTAENEAAWNKVLDELGIPFGNVESVVLTHHHPDHLGLSGWFQEKAGCPVRMSARAAEEMQRMWGEASTMNDDLPLLFRQHGMPEAWTSQLPAHLESFIPQVEPLPSALPLTEGEPLEMGGRRWIPIETWGHAPGHMSLLHEESGVMLCGDAVLPQISPNVSLLPGSDPEPLHSFLNGLRKLQSFQVKRAYPGHRNPFDHFVARLEALLQHHEERLVRVLGRIQAGPATGFELCAALFGTALGIHQMRFAMCETLAHTQELERRGQVMKVPGHDGIFRYEAAVT